MRYIVGFQDFDLCLHGGRIDNGVAHDRLLLIQFIVSINDHGGGGGVFWKSGRQVNTGK